MNQNDPMTPIMPPAWLVKELQDLGNIDAIALAYQAGSDMELEACCEWLGDAPVVYNDNDDLHPGSYLRDARRPKMSLKEEALALINSNKPYLDDAAMNTIRRALEAQ